MKKTGHCDGQGMCRYDGCSFIDSHNNDDPHYTLKKCPDTNRHPCHQCRALRKSNISMYEKFVNILKHYLKNNNGTYIGNMLIEVNEALSESTTKFVTIITEFNRLLINLEMIKQQYFVEIRHPKPELKKFKNGTKYCIEFANDKYNKLIDDWNEEYIESMCNLELIKHTLNNLNESEQKCFEDCLSEY